MAALSARGGGGGGESATAAARRASAGTAGDAAGIGAVWYPSEEPLVRSCRAVARAPAFGVAPAPAAAGPTSGVGAAAAASSRSGEVLAARRIRGGYREFLDCAASRDHRRARLAPVVAALAAEDVHDTDTLTSNVAFQGPFVVPPLRAAASAGVASRPRAVAAPTAAGDGAGDAAGVGAVV